MATNTDFNNNNRVKSPDLLQSQLFTLVQERNSLQRIIDHRIGFNPKSFHPSPNNNEKHHNSINEISNPSKRNRRLSNIQNRSEKSRTDSPTSRKENVDSTSLLNDGENSEYSSSDDEISTSYSKYNTNSDSLSDTTESVYSLLNKRKTKSQTHFTSDKIPVYLRDSSSQTDFLPLSDTEIIKKLESINKKEKEKYLLLEKEFEKNKREGELVFIELRSALHRSIDTNTSTTKKKTQPYKEVVFQKNDETKAKIGDSDPGTWSGPGSGQSSRSKARLSLTSAFISSKKHPNSNTVNNIPNQSSAFLKDKLTETTKKNRELEKDIARIESRLHHYEQTESRLQGLRSKLLHEQQDKKRISEELISLREELHGALETKLLNSNSNKKNLTPNLSNTDVDIHLKSVLDKMSKISLKMSSPYKVDIPPISTLTENDKNIVNNETVLNLFTKQSKKELSSLMESNVEEEDTIFPVGKNLTESDTTESSKTNTNLELMTSSEIKSNIDIYTHKDTPRSVKVNINNTNTKPKQNTVETETVKDDSTSTIMDSIECDMNEKTFKNDENTLEKNNNKIIIDKNNSNDSIIERLNTIESDIERLNTIESDIERLNTIESDIERLNTKSDTNEKSKTETQKETQKETHTNISIEHMNDINNNNRISDKTASSVTTKTNNTNSCSNSNSSSVINNRTKTSTHIKTHSQSQKFNPKKQSVLKHKEKETGIQTPGFGFMSKQKQNPYRKPRPFTPIAAPKPKTTTTTTNTVRRQLKNQNQTKTTVSTFNNNSKSLVNSRSSSNLHTSYSSFRSS